MNTFLEWHTSEGRHVLYTKSWIQIISNLNHFKCRSREAIRVTSLCTTMAAFILWMCPANERQCYIVTSSLIGWAHKQKDPCYGDICVPLLSVHGEDYVAHTSLILGLCPANERWRYKLAGANLESTLLLTLQFSCQFLWWLNPTPAGPSVGLSGAMLGVKLDKNDGSWTWYSQ